MTFVIDLPHFLVYTNSVTDRQMSTRMYISSAKHQIKLPEWLVALWRVILVAVVCATRVKYRRVTRALKVTQELEVVDIKVAG